MHQAHEEGGFDRRGAQCGNSLGDQAMESTTLKTTTVTIEKNLQILQLFEMERTMEESTTLLVASVFSSFKIGRF